jgi:DNA-binding NarL/FixJ family response regulator
MKNINVLIVDDHPFIILGYKNGLKLYPKKKFEFTTFEATDCKTGYEIITNPPVEFDIAFLDISMPAYPEKNILSGEDLAKLLKEKMPLCKIILLTMHDERLKVEKVIDEINPIGLIIKSDLTFETMKLAIQSVLQNQFYYSDAVNNYLNLMQSEIVYTDVINKQILFYLNKGIDADDVALYIPILSSQYVHERIAEMKELLEIPEATNEELVVLAKQKGMML